MTLHLLAQLGAAACSNARRIELHRIDNDGYKYLKECYPHVLCRLEELTANWVLCGKVVVRSAAVLSVFTAIFRENLNLQVNYSPYPAIITPPEYTQLMCQIILYLEEDVWPILDAWASTQLPGQAT